MSLSSVVRNGPLSPAVTGALLYALTKAPEKYRQRLLDTLSQYLSAKGIRRTITALKWLCALGIARNLNIWLSSIALNNFRLSSERHRYNWPNEVAVVTGAASGFGALIAKGLAAHGIRVIAVDVKTQCPDDIQLHPKITYYSCDITDRGAVLELAQKVRDQYGDVSILVNNAGVGTMKPLLDMPEDAVNQTFQVNTISHYWTLQAWMPAMIANKKGHIVTIASMASFGTAPGMVAYCSSKSAVLSFHEGVAREARMYNAPEIKFTSIHPTFADTPLLAPFKDKVEGRAVILDPNVVSNAVVNQILSCRSGQLLIAPDSWWLAGMRAWPHWLSQGFIRSTEQKVHTMKKGTVSSSTA